jgi:hypothetical protein
MTSDKEVFPESLPTDLGTGAVKRNVSRYQQRLGHILTEETHDSSSLRLYVRLAILANIRPGGFRKRVSECRASRIRVVGRVDICHRLMSARVTIS